VLFSHFILQQEVTHVVRVTSNRRCYSQSQVNHWQWQWHWNHHPVKTCSTAWFLWSTRFPIAVFHHLRDVYSDDIRRVWHVRCDREVENGCTMTMITQAGLAHQGQQT